MKCTLRDSLHLLLTLGSPSLFYQIYRLPEPSAAAAEVWLQQVLGYGSAEVVVALLVGRHRSAEGKAMSETTPRDLKVDQESASPGAGEAGPSDGKSQKKGKLKSQRPSWRYAGSFFLVSIGVGG